jgi:branched-chain amino acid transport system substrate-binding protein
VPLAGAMIALALVLLSALGDSPAGAQGAAEPLTVYSSLPLSGANHPQATAIVQGARLALEDAGGMAGGHSVRYVSLNDATRRAGTWTPELASRNARRAAQDESSVAYIGEFNSAASAISIPILNEVPIAQISPSNSAIGLTRSGPGADAGEPEKYYPTGRRHYFRIAPNDRVQGGALAVAMRDRGCRRIAALTDGELYGAGLGAWVRLFARRLGLRVVYKARIRPSRPHFRGLARRIRRTRPRCVVFTGIAPNRAVQLFRDLARGLPRAKLFGGDGLTGRGFTDRREGGVPPRVARRVLVTRYPLAPEAVPDPGRAVLLRYAMRWGDSSPDTYALQGYEAMKLVLDGISVVGPDRLALIGWLRGVRNRESVLGTYSFNRFGDTTLRDYGVYGIRRGALRWAGVVRAP